MYLDQKGQDGFFFLYFFIFSLIRRGNILSKFFSVQSIILDKCFNVSSQKLLGTFTDLNSVRATAEFHPCRSFISILQKGVRQTAEEIRDLGQDHEQDITADTADIADPSRNRNDNVNQKSWYYKMLHSKLNEAIPDKPKEADQSPLTGRKARKPREQGLNPAVHQTMHQTARMKAHQR